MRNLILLSLCLSIAAWFVGFYSGQDSVSSIADDTRWQCDKECP